MDGLDENERSCLCCRIHFEAVATESQLAKFTDVTFSKFFVPEKLGCSIQERNRTLLQLTHFNILMKVRSTHESKTVFFTKIGESQAEP